MSRFSFGSLGRRCAVEHGLSGAAHALRGNGNAVDETLLQYLSPLGWEHINQTGDYLWRGQV